MLRRLAILVVCAALIASGYGIYTKLSSPEGGSGGQMPPAAVQVAEVVVRDARSWQTFSGKLVAADSADVRPQVSGVIQRVHFREGEWVKKGTPLFTIDPRPYAATLQAARAKEALATTEWERAKTLLAERAISQRDHDLRKNNAEVARAELARAELDMEYASVRAPISGRVGRAEITEGNVVSAAAAPLLTTVVADKPIYADFDIDEQTYLTYLRQVGTDPKKILSIPVYLGLADELGEPHKGHMRSFDNQLSAGSGTLRVRTEFPNADSTLIPGLYARIRISGTEIPGAVLITERAISTDQSKKTVIVMKDDNTTERREVVLGGVSDGLRMVQSGLQAGERIVVNGTQRVMMPGQSVTPEIVPMESPAASAPEPASPPT